jgi:hypothetical protein
MRADTIFLIQIEARNYQIAFRESKSSKEMKQIYDFLQNEVLKIK